MKDYPERRSSVIIHRMEKNSGQAEVRKWGIQNASGEYIIHCDSDDWVDKDLYLSMYEKAVTDKVDVVVCDYRLTNGTSIINEVKGCGSTEKESFIQRLLLQRDPWSLCNKLFSRRVCYKDLVYPEGNMGEDMLLCIQMVCRCTKIGYVPDNYYYYYCNENSISNLRDISLHIRNYEQLKLNTDIMIELLNTIFISHKTWIVNSLQYNATITLLNVIHNSSVYRDLWMNTYPGSNIRFLINPFAKLSDRIKCLLALIGLYPFKKDRLS